MSHNKNTKFKNEPLLQQQNNQQQQGETKLFFILLQIALTLTSPFDLFFKLFLKVKNNIDIENWFLVIFSLLFL